MKKVFPLFFFLMLNLFSWAQLSTEKHSVDVQYLYGNILQHSPEIAHLITGHPEGFLLSYNHKTFGEEDWQAAYSYPDYGFSYAFQDMKNENLGDNHSLYAHYNFYFLNRKLQFRVGQGFTYNTNPYDQDKNFRNIAYGTHLLASTYLMLNFIQKDIFKNLGLQAGFTLIHYSNGNFKAPNTSTNTLNVNLGLNYGFGQTKERETVEVNKEAYQQPIALQVFFRGGVQTSDVIGMGQFPFYIPGVSLKKRLSLKSSVSLGSEIFFSPMLQEYIKYRSIAFPSENLSGDESSTRVGVFAGYQLHLGKNSVFGNLGYYLYYPYDFEGRVYLRAGYLRQVFEGFSVGLSVKSHAAKAEAVELNLNYQL